MANVSIPDGLPRPFSHGINNGLGLVATVSIPDGLPRPFSLRPGILVELESCMVSIPDGLPRPFSLDSLRGETQANVLFQSQTGFPGHLAPRPRFPW